VQEPDDVLEMIHTAPPPNAMNISANTMITPPAEAPAVVLAISAEARIWDGSTDTGKLSASEFPFQSSTR
jgi:hypothetical protein